MWNRIFKFRIYNRTFSTFPRLHKVFVKVESKEERMIISFNYGLEGKKQREFNFHRKKDDAISATLKCIHQKLQVKLARQVRKEQQKKEDNVAIATNNNPWSVTLFDRDDKVIETTVTNIEAWKTGCNLDINGRKLPVDVNYPLVRKITLPQSILAGFPVYPLVDAQFVDLEKSKYVWYRSERTLLSSQLGQSHKDSIDSDVWKEVSRERCYTPSSDDVGCKVKVVFTPHNESMLGSEVESVSEFEVAAEPDSYPFEVRHTMTQHFAGENSFRIVSYNLLADFYADSRLSRNFLFPYCPSHALEIDYRKALLIKELKGYNADIVCLQEVDEKVFDDLQTSLGENGLKGLLKMKSKKVTEGSAVFYRESKFRCIQQSEFNLTQYLRNEHEELWSKIKENEDFKDRLIDRRTILQVCILQSTDQSNKHLIIGNTHLYARPRAGNIRLLHTYACLQFLSRLKESYVSKGLDPVVMFCGDFNSSPRSGAVELVEQRNVSPFHADWFTGGVQQLFGQIELSHNLRLTSACGYPEYTNFVSSYYGCIDYIFMDTERLRVEQVVPLPSHSEVVRYTALPNPVFPSDHLALVCDLNFT